MVGLIRRAGGEVDPDGLQEKLLEILYATGTAHDGSQRALLIHEAIGAVWARENLAPAFRRVARARNPLHPSVLHPKLRLQLERRVQNRWGLRWRLRGRGRPSLDQLVWTELSAEEQHELREMAVGLAITCQSLYPGHRPRNHRIETLLVLLAELFAEFIGYQAHPDTLPHSAEGYFIQFGSRALAPFFSDIESDAELLSKRWKRRQECPPSAIRRAKPRERRPGPKRGKPLN